MVWEYPLGRRLNINLNSIFVDEPVYVIGYHCNSSLPIVLIFPANADRDESSKSQKGGHGVWFA